MVDERDFSHEFRLVEDFDSPDLNFKFSSPFCRILGYISSNEYAEVYFRDFDYDNRKRREKYKTYKPFRLRVLMDRVISTYGMPNLYFPESVMVIGSVCFFDKIDESIVLYTALNEVDMMYYKTLVTKGRKCLAIYAAVIHNIPPTMIDDMYDNAKFLNGCLREALKNEQIDESNNNFMDKFVMDQR